MSNEENFDVLNNWLPAGKKAAVCFSIDDIHPGKSTDYYEAGGDLDKGALGHVAWLTKRHEELKVTLFVTADWREIYPFPIRRILASLPVLRDKCFLGPMREKGTMSLERHAEFVRFLKDMRGVEIGLHGLYHFHRGKDVAVEFQNETREEILETCNEMLRIFRSAGIDYVAGMCPPGWNAPDSLLDVMIQCGLKFVASSRDIFTEISPQALTNMSGTKGMSLIYPQFIRPGKLLHFPSNFNPSCPIDRAIAIIENGGLLSIKAHIVKNCFGRIAFDGLDEGYRNYLDVLFSTLKSRYGDELWWTSMGEMSDFAFSQLDQNTKLAATV